MADRSRRAKHAVENVAFGAVTSVVRVVPRPVALALGGALGRFAFDALRLRRSVAVRNVEDTLEPPGGRPEAVRIARASYSVLGRTFCDLVRIDRFSDALLWRALRRPEFEIVERVSDQGRGVIFVSGHFGNWELLLLGIRRLGVSVAALAGVQANSTVNDRINRTRARAGIPTLSPRTGLRDVLAILGRGGAVATLADQDARHKGIFVDFLGRPSSTHTGMFALSLRTGAPVVAGVLVDAEGGYRLEAAGPWTPDPEASEQENLRAGATWFNRFLEEKVRKYPGNYLWAHRRWKTRPGAQA